MATEAQKSYNAHWTDLVCSVETVPCSLDILPEDDFQPAI